MHTQVALQGLVWYFVLYEKSINLVSVHKSNLFYRIANTISKFLYLPPWRKFYFIFVQESLC